MRVNFLVKKCSLDFFFCLYFLLRLLRLNCATLSVRKNMEIPRGLYIFAQVFKMIKNALDILYKTWYNLYYIAITRARIYLLL